MNKKQIIELCQIKLAGGDVTSEVEIKYPHQTVDKVCEVVYSDFIYQMFAANPREFRADLSSFTKRYQGVLVEISTDSNEKYCLLPFKLVQLPKDFAVKTVRPINNSAYFIITSKGATGNTITVQHNTTVIGTYTILVNDTVLTAMQGITDDINDDTETHNVVATFDGEKVWLKDRSGTMNVLTVNVTGGVTVTKSNFTLISVNANPYLYRDNMFDATYDILPVGSIIKKKSFYILNDKLYLRNLTDDLLLSMDLVVPWSGYSESEEIRFPMNQDKVFIQTVVEEFLRQTPSPDQNEDGKLQEGK